MLFHANRRAYEALCRIAGGIERLSTNRILPLRDDVRRQLIFDKGDAVAQLQFALFESLNLDEVGSGRILQRCNRGIEVAMLLLQARKLRPKLAFFLFRHRRLGRGPVVGMRIPSRLTAGEIASKSLSIIAFWLIAHKAAKRHWSGDFRKRKNGVSLQ